VFRSAYDALRALNVYDVEEIRSYRTPPRQVVLVVNAVCLLFGKEETYVFLLDTVFVQCIFF
jgi:hypothetical protein